MGPSDSDADLGILPFSSSEWKLIYKSARNGATVFGGEQAVQGHVRSYRMQECI